MKTSVIEVRDMLSVLSVDGVEERIGKVPGVESVTVNFAARSATVRYDETRLELADIKSDVRQGGYESDAPVAARSGDGPPGKETPAASGAAPDLPAAASPQASAAVPAPQPVPDAAAGSEQKPDKTEPSKT